MVHRYDGTVRSTIRRYDGTVQRYDGKLHSATTTHVSVLDKICYSEGCNRQF